MTSPQSETLLYPLFLKLVDKKVLLVGGSTTAESKLKALLEAGAHVILVAPTITVEQRHPNLTLVERPFKPEDLDDVFYVITAAPPLVNQEVSREAEKRHLFVNAVDDKENATAYLGSVIRQEGFTVALSSEGASPALTKLLRQGFESLLDPDLARWRKVSEKARIKWNTDKSPHRKRVPQLLDAINALYFPKQPPEQSS